jgi:hypothetical protein
LVREVAEYLPAAGEQRAFELLQNLKAGLNEFA